MQRAVLDDAAKFGWPYHSFRLRQQSLDEIRAQASCRIDNAQVFKPVLRCIQRCRRNIHAHESLGWNLDRLRIPPFVRIECQTRLRSDYDRQCDNGAEVIERMRPRYSLHCFSWLRRETADTETTRQSRLRRRR